MSSPIAEAVAGLLLVATLAGAILRPKGLPEAVVAIPAAGILLLLGVLPLSQASAEARSLGPTIGFLAAVLVLAVIWFGVSITIFVFLVQTGRVG